MEIFTHFLVLISNLFKKSQFLNSALWGLLLLKLLKKTWKFHVQDLRKKFLKKTIFSSVLSHLQNPENYQISGSYKMMYLRFRSKTTIRDENNRDLQIQEQLWILNDDLAQLLTILRSPLPNVQIRIELSSYGQRWRKKLKKYT